MPDTSNVVAIHGGLTGLPEPNDNCIATLERWLEMARAGEIIGFAGAALHHDGLSQYAISGFIGGYSVLGAVEMAKADLTDHLRECD